MDSNYDARVTPWSIRESDFESLATTRDRAKFLLGYAILAPSGHNTQPWKFTLTDDGVEVFADMTRRLPAANPDDRELVMSVAAAITNLRVAAAHFGLACEVAYLPEPGRDDLMAAARLGEGEPDAGLARLFDGIKKRRTNRFEYRKQPLSPEHLARLREGSSLGGASLAIIDDENLKGRLADVVHRADLVRMADKAFTRELSEWVRPNSSTAGDGMTASSLGIPALVSGVAPWLLRTFNTGKSQAKKESAAVRDSAAVAIVHSPDGRKEVLEAGELLERMLLECALMGVQYSFFNLPVELDDLRARIKELAGTGDEPQLMLRLGYGETITAGTPRRPVEDVLVG